LGGDNNSDAAVLRKKIAELEIENKQLKNAPVPVAQPSQSTLMGQTSSGDRDWLNFGGSNKGPLERPITAAGRDNAKVRELETQLK